MASEIEVSHHSSYKDFGPPDLLLLTLLHTVATKRHIIPTPAEVRE